MRSCRVFMSLEEDWGLELLVVVSTTLTNVYMSLENQILDSSMCR